MIRAREIWHIVKNTFRDFMNDRAFQLGAALSFYALLSLSPLLILLISVAGMVFGPDEVRHEVVGQIETLVGPQGAQVVGTILENANTPQGNVIGIAVGAITLLLGATGVFAQLQSSLNQIWQVEAKPGLGAWGVIRTRLVSLLMVAVIGLLLLASVIVSALFTAVNTYMSDLLPSLAPTWSIINFLVSLIITTLLFAMVFKLLPDVQISWASVWVGAFVTGLLFTIGKSLIGLYLGYSSVGSVYGAAGSVVALIVWIYYSSLIVFLGAEFTQVYARRFGVRIQPSPNAVRIDGREEGGGRLAGAH